MKLLKSYVQTTLRGMRRRPGYTILNVVGLAVGLASFLVGVLFVTDELNYDRFYEHANELYRLHYVSGGSSASAASGYIAGEVLTSEYGDRVNVARLRHWAPRKTVRYRERSFIEEKLFMADPAVFDVLELRLLHGDPAHALVAPNSIVLTEPMANKYFGHEDPLGKIIHVDNRTYTVTGVLDARPPNSHLQFNFLVTMHPEGVWRNDTSWQYNRYYTYVRVSDHDLVAELEHLLTARVREAAQEEGAAHSHALMPIADIHLHGPSADALQPGGSLSYLYIFSAIAFLILLIACVNFINLATARSADRVREVGVRKILGARRRQLFIQFIGEAVLLTTFAVVVAPGLAALALPTFSDLAGKQLTLSFVDQLWLAPFLGGLVLIVGLAAGCYPALVLSAFEPLRVLKGRGGRGARSSLLRRGLVVAQFAITTFIVIGTLIISRQMNYLQQVDRGVDAAQILIVETGNSGRVHGHYGLLKAELEKQPSVEGVTATSSIPGREPGYDSFRLEGFPPEDSLLRAQRLVVNYDFAETYGIQVVQGRDFNRAFGTDFDEAFLINEAAVELFGGEDPIGKQLGLFDHEGQIVGIVENFNFATLHEKIEPLVLDIANSFNFVSIRLNVQDVPGALAQVNDVWNGILPGEPLAYYFLSEDFERTYRSEMKLRKTLGCFSILAIFVSCLGLFGLASFAAEQRTKEIGIRKVLGASIAGVVALLSRDFLKLVGLAFVVATPVAYLAMERWLESFAYRIEISPEIFVLTGALVLLVAFLTVSYQAIKAALADPVKSLRYE